MNGLSTSTERQAVRVVKKNELYVVFKKPSLNIKTYQLKVKGWKKIKIKVKGWRKTYNASTNPNKAQIDSLISA